MPVSLFAKSDDYLELRLVGSIGIAGDPGSVWLRDIRDALEGREGRALVCVHSRGGNVQEALAIHEYLQGLRMDLTTRMEEVVASSASVIAMAGRRVEIEEGTQLMLHSCTVYQRAEVLASAAALVLNLNSSLAEIYAGRTRRSVEDELRMLCAPGNRLLEAEAVVSEGYAHVVVPFRRKPPSVMRVSAPPVATITSIRDVPSPPRIHRPNIDVLPHCALCELPPERSLEMIGRASGWAETECLVAGICHECLPNFLAADKAEMWASIEKKVSRIPERLQLFRGPQSEVIRYYSEEKMSDINRNELNAVLKQEIEQATDSQHPTTKERAREARAALEGEAALARWRKAYREATSDSKKAQKEVEVLDRVVSDLERDLAALREKDEAATSARIQQIILDRIEGRAAGASEPNCNREIEELSAVLEEARLRRDEAQRVAERHGVAMKDARQKALQARADIARGGVICLARAVQRYRAEELAAFYLMGEKGRALPVEIEVSDEVQDVADARLRGELADLLEVQHDLA